MLAGLFALLDTARSGGVTDIAGAVQATTTSAEIEQGVHFQLDPAALDPLATAAGVSLYEFRREAEYLWSFGEDYAFADLPVDYHGPTGSGAASGPFAAHAYKAPGSYTVECLWYFRGSIWRSTLGVTVSDTSFTSAETGVCDPDGDWTGFPAHDVANRFTDPDEALRAWDVSVGTIRHLVFRAGKTYSIKGHPDQNTAQPGGRTARYRPPAPGARISTIGSGRAVLNVVYGDGGIELYTWLLKQRGDGVQTDFVHSTTLPADTAVYLGTALQTAGTDYTVETTNVPDDTVRFLSAPGSDVPVYLFDAAADGALSSFGSDLILANQDGLVISGLDIRGGYDAAAPGIFDPADLSTWEHAIVIDAIGASDAVNDVTVFDCAISGFRGQINMATGGDNHFAIGCDLTSWYDYGFYGGGRKRYAAVGCSIRQKVDALNGPGSKSENKVGVANHPDHGPIRWNTAYECVINRSVLESRNGWAGADTVGDTNAQPCARIPQNFTPLMSFCLTETTTYNGEAVAAGVPNDKIAVPASDIMYLAQNVHVGGIATARFLSGQFPYSVLNSVFYLPDAPLDSSFELAAINTAGGATQSQDGVREVGHQFINCTIIVKADRPTRNCTLGGPFQITDTGIVNEVGRATVSGTPSSVDVVTTLSGTNNGNNHAWRVWRKASGEADSAATSQGTVSERNTIYSLSEPDADPAADPTVTVTLVSGTFADGDVVILTRENCAETPDFEIVGGEPVYTGGSLPLETYFPNNRTAAVGLAEPVFDNCLIGIDGDWSTFKLLDSGAAETPADWRTSRFDPISTLFQPQSGSPALGAAKKTDWVTASGGTVTAITEGADDYTVHEFTADGTFEVTEGGQIEYLIVGGGGGGSTAGGGAGGVVQGSMTIAPGSYPVTVGAGGAGIIGDATPRPAPATPGEDSSFAGLVALGGGPGSGTDGGADTTGDEAEGGSGGGGGSSSQPAQYVTVLGSALQPGSASGGLGHDGGEVEDFTSPFYAGGGGGAGGPGQSPGNPGTWAAGGAGITTTIAGAARDIAGGGAGGEWGTGTGIAGAYGGGSGGAGYPLSERDGTPNTGGGGGGGGPTAPGGTGGTGLVIIRYLTGA